MSAYVRAASTDVSFFNFIIQTVLHVDHMQHVARQTLDNKEYLKDAGKLAQEDPGRGTRFLRENAQGFLEMFVARMVDNFQKYLVDLIREILHSKPDMLRTRQQSLTLEELLGYKRIEDLVHDVIERKVNSLSYEGFAELEKWCLERGIVIEIPSPEGNRIIELIATRNIVAHNRCIVDERYLRTVRASKLEAGVRRALNVEYFFDSLLLLNNIAFKTDAASRKKFSLPAVKFEPEAAKSEGDKALSPAADGDGMAGTQS